MAMIECSECCAEISSNAVSCPKCGNPLPKEIVVHSKTGMSVKGWIFSIFGVIIGLFILFAILGSSPEMRANAKNKDDARKMECVNAVVEIGKVTSYVDKQAYEKVVAEKCEGLTIDGQPIH